MYEQYLSELADWLNTPKPGKRNYLGLVLVSNDAKGPARYAEGALTFQRFTFNNIVSSSFQGEVTLYESSEKHYQRLRRNRFDGPHPFDPERTDEVSVNISFSGSTGNVIRIGSANKGQAVISNPQYEQGLIFGFADKGNGDLGVGEVEFIPNPKNPWSGYRLTLRPYYVLSFYMEEVDIVK